MRIFAVITGEKHEGGEIVGLFSKYEDARTCALSIPRCFDGGWTEQDMDFWLNGCDFVKITQHELAGVQPTTVTNEVKKQFVSMAERRRFEALVKEKA